MLDFTSMNQEQRNAVQHPEGNLLVLAGPGSGKTAVLINRLLYRIECGRENPEGFLVITFTKAAARSMEQRFRLLSSGRSYSIAFSTFHSFFYQILKRHAGIGPDSFLTEAEKHNLLLPILQQFQNQEPPAQWLERFGRYQNNGEDCLDQESFMPVFQAYQEAIRQRNKTDFDDMAGQCLELFSKCPKICKEWAERYPHILIDEFQDINVKQYQVIQALGQRGSTVFAVGDDDQSIYGFRGSNPNLMRAFLKDFVPAGQITLFQNYRSHPDIVYSSRKVIEENRNRIPKDLKPVKDGGGRAVRIHSFAAAEEEYDFLERTVKAYAKNTERGEIAIIARTNALAAEIQRQLSKRQVLCRTQGRNKTLWEHFVVQDILSYLKFAKEKPERSLFLQIRNKPDRGIGREALTEEKIDWEGLCRFYEKVPQTVKKIQLLQKEIQEIKRLPLFLAINYIRKKIGYDRYLQEKAGQDKKDGKTYAAIADKLQEYSRQFPDWKEFQVRLKQDFAKEEEGGGAEGTIRILTMHMSKGLEFERVILPDCNEGTIPKGRSLRCEELEEERRLFYVAMTRAKKTLDILYLTGTEQYPRQSSQFLRPIL